MREHVTVRGWKKCVGQTCSSADELNGGLAFKSSYRASPRIAEFVLVCATINTESPTIEVGSSIRSWGKEALRRLDKKSRRFILDLV